MGNVAFLMYLGFGKISELQVNKFFSVVMKFYKIMEGRNLEGVWSDKDKYV